jgi:hypothetical protein
MLCLFVVVVVAVVVVFVVVFGHREQINDELVSCSLAERTLRCDWPS